MEQVQLVVFSGQGKRRRYEYLRRALNIKNERRSTFFLMENGNFPDIIRLLRYIFFRK